MSHPFCVTLLCIGDSAGGLFVDGSLLICYNWMKHTRLCRAQMCLRQFPESQTIHDEPIWYHEGGHVCLSGDACILFSDMRRAPKAPLQLETLIYALALA